MYEPVTVVPLLLAIGLTAPQDPATIEISAGFRVGDKVEIEVAKEAIDVVEGTQVPEHRRTARIRLEVVRQEKAGWVLAWTYGPTEVEPATTLSTALANLHTGLRLLIRTDPAGRPKSLENPDAALAFYSQMRKQAAADLKAKGMRPEALERVFSDLDRVMTRESIEVVVLRDPRLFLGTLGVSLPVGGKTKLERQEPNALGGDPIPSHGEMKLESHDPAKKEAKITWKLVLDTEKARPILLASLRKMAKKAGKPEPKPEDVPAIEVEKLGVAVIDLNKGWPKQLRRMVTTKQGKRGRIESTTILVLEARR